MPADPEMRNGAGAFPVSFPVFSCVFSFAMCGVAFFIFPPRLSGASETALPPGGRFRNPGNPESERKS